MEFVWDRVKAAANAKKHGIVFEEACTVFLDPLSATGADPDHSAGEERWLTFGRSSGGRLLVVAHTDRGDTVRIISARRCTASERKLYEKA
ncbi:MAG: BrnT family toxin [Rhodanobacteraceae bacterium]